MNLEQAKRKAQASVPETVSIAPAFVESQDPYILRYLPSARWRRRA